MATRPCKECSKYDPIGRKTGHGRCSLKSIYPMKEGPGQVFPLGVTRMTEEGKPCKPFVVRGDSIATTCPSFTSK